MDFWQSLTETDRCNAASMRRLLTVELAVVDGDRKQACKEILGAASDEDLKALRVPAKFAFMQVMKDSGPVDDEEYALWGRMYACHVTEDLKPCFVRELAALSVCGRKPLLPQACFAQSLRKSRRFHARLEPGGKIAQKCFWAVFRTETCH